ncbi:MAG: hypothetical protein UHH95_02355, partial [Oscillospiraceae bacterium]|nr:hypothetical protein [Oscillospiraceae bacterium]
PDDIVCHIYNTITSAKLNFAKGSVERDATGQRRTITMKKISNERFEENSVIISSMRLDCVVAALTGKSRADSAKLVTSERVSVNHEIITSCSKTLYDSDVLSIRSFGKFIIGSCVSKTKKGRLVLLYKKYI